MNAEDYEHGMDAQWRQAEIVATTDLYDSPIRVRATPIYFANSFDRLRDDADHERGEGEQVEPVQDEGYDVFKSERLQRIMDAR